MPPFIVPDDRDRLPLDIALSHLLIHVSTLITESLPALLALRMPNLDSLSLSLLVITANRHHRRRHLPVLPTAAVPRPLLPATKQAAIESCSVLDCWEYCKRGRNV